MKPKDRNDGSPSCLFNETSLRDGQNAASHCEEMFREIAKELERAFTQIDDKRRFDHKIRLSVAEKAKWPFMTPKVEALHSEMRDAKNNLLLILSVTSLAHAETVSLQYASSNHRIYGSSSSCCTDRAKKELRLHHQSGIVLKALCLHLLQLLDRPCIQRKNHPTQRRL